MARKGGLGQLAQTASDPLDMVFGGKPQEPETDTPPPHAGAKAEKADTASLYLQLDKAMVRQIKIYALEHDLKIKAVITSALQEFLARNSK